MKSWVATMLILLLIIAAIICGYSVRQSSCRSNPNGKKFENFRIPGASAGRIGLVFLGGSIRPERPTSPAERGFILVLIVHLAGLQNKQQCGANAEKEQTADNNSQLMEQARMQFPGEQTPIHVERHQGGRTERNVLEYCRDLGDLHRR